jgi:DNA polymerase-1
VLLEWDGEKGKNPVPLLKDVYSNERKRAKTLNFSIAYGKTVHGFAKDWGSEMFFFLSFLLFFWSNCASSYPLIS